MCRRLALGWAPACCSARRVLSPEPQSVHCRSDPLVTQPSEVARGTVEGAVNFPLSSLRQQLQQLPRDKKIYAFCQVGAERWSG